MQYSISDLEQLSGISAHNIRIWERRYNALQPLRTAGNTRSYDDGQLKKLLGIVTLFHAGYKVSNICKWSGTEFNKQMDRVIADGNIPERNQEYYIAELIRFALDYDEDGVNTLIEAAIEKFGLPSAYQTVVYPLLTRVGLLWLNTTLCPAQEHFLSQILRQKLFAAIDKESTPRLGNAGHWLLFLPEDEEHDIGLLLANLLLRQTGARITYLGPRVPLETLLNAVDKTVPDHLFLMLTRTRSASNGQRMLEELSVMFPQIKIFVSGNVKLLNAVSLPPNISWLKDPDEFLQTIHHLII